MILGSLFGLEPKLPQPQCEVLPLHYKLHNFIYRRSDSNRQPTVLKTVDSAVGLRRRYNLLKYGIMIVSKSLPFHSWALEFISSGGENNHGEGVVGRNDSRYFDGPSMGADRQINDP